VWYEGVDILPLLRDDEYEYLMEQAEKYEADDD
jgi:hypothetical protein